MCSAGQVYLQTLGSLDPAVRGRLYSLGRRPHGEILRPELDGFKQVVYEDRETEDQEDDEDRERDKEQDTRDPARRLRHPGIKPSAPAMIEITKKTRAHFSIAASSPRSKAKHVMLELRQRSSLFGQVQSRAASAAWAIWRD